MAKAVIGIVVVVALVIVVFLGLVVFLLMSAPAISYPASGGVELNARMGLSDAEAQFHDADGNSWIVDLGDIRQGEAIPLPEDASIYESVTVRGKTLGLPVSHIVMIQTPGSESDITDEGAD